MRFLWGVLAAFAAWPTYGEPITPPTKPSVVRQGIDNFKLDWSWTGATSNVSNVKLHRSKKGSSDSKAIKVFDYPKKKATTLPTSYFYSHVDKAPDAGKQRVTFVYWVEVVTRSGFEVSSAKAEVDVWWAPPLARAQAASSKSILLQWTPQSYGETGFEILHKSGNKWPVLATVAGNVTSFEHKNLATGSSHSYKVRAVASSEQTKPSEPVTAVPNATASPVLPSTPTPTAPPPPANVSCLPYAPPDARIVVQWTPPYVGTLPAGAYAQLVLLRPAANGGNPQVIAELPAGSTSYEDRAVTTGTPFSYALQTKVVGVGVPPATVYSAPSPTRTCSLPSPSRLSPKFLKVKLAGNYLSQLADCSAPELRSTVPIAEFDLVRQFFWLDPTAADGQRSYSCFTLHADGAAGVSWSPDVPAAIGGCDPAKTYQTPFCSLGATASSVLSGNAVPCSATSLEIYFSKLHTGTVHDAPFLPPTEAAPQNGLPLEGTVVLGTEDREALPVLYFDARDSIEASPSQCRLTRLPKAVFTRSSAEIAGAP